MLDGFSWVLDRVVGVEQLRVSDHASAWARARSGILHGVSDEPSHRLELTFEARGVAGGVAQCGGRDPVPRAAWAV